MASLSDRDRDLERMLRTMPAGTPTSACLDAEELAAWADGRLATEPSAQIEEHLADCHRCQSMAAAFARSGELAAGRVPWWHRASIRWAVPATVAAAAAMFIMLSLPKRQTAPDSQLVRNEQPVAMPTNPSINPVPMRGESSQRDGGDRKALSPVATPSEAAVPTPPSPQAQPIQQPWMPPPLPVSPFNPMRILPGVADANPSRDFAQWNSGRYLRINGGLSQNKNTTIDGIPSGEEGRDGTTHITPNTDAVGELSTPANPAAPRSAAVGSETAAPVRAGRGTEALQTAARSITSSPQVIAQFASVGSDEAGTVAVDGNAQPFLARRDWRILSTGLVQWTANASVWNSVDVPSGVLAGSAPSPAVCWLVGRAGLVLVTVDGARFRRIQFPEPIDLASVRATSANQAVVTAANGNVFVTFDGGQTWRSGLQENPRPSF